MQVNIWIYSVKQHSELNHQTILIIFLFTKADIIKTSFWKVSKEIMIFIKMYGCVSNLNPKSSDRTFFKEEVLLLIRTDYSFVWEELWESCTLNDIQWAWLFLRLNCNRRNNIFVYMEVKRKNSACAELRKIYTNSVSLLHFHMTTTLNPSDPRWVCVSYPQHQPILWHQLGVLQFNSFWHDLPGGSVRPHRWRSQSHSSAPLNFRCPSQVQVVLCTSDQSNKLEIPTTPSLGSRNLLEMLTELRKTVYLLFTALL